MSQVTQAMKQPRERDGSHPQDPHEDIPHPLPPARREAAKKQGPYEEEDNQDCSSYPPSQDRVLSRWKGLRNSRPLSEDVNDGGLRRRRWRRHRGRLLVVETVIQLLYSPVEGPQTVQDGSWHGLRGTVGLADERSATSGPDGLAKARMTDHQTHWSSRRRSSQPGR
jgi:hypothetical protein